MNLLSKRAAVLLILSLLLAYGLLLFAIRFFNHASAWAHHPANKHLYAEGNLVCSGTIYDRFGHILAQVDEGAIKYSEDKAVRTAVMHAVGDLEGNVATGALAAFSSRLSGWDIINGAYRFQPKQRELWLTLDADLCATAYRELRGSKGTVGVYNYKTGEILCMVSTPSFDPLNPPDLDADPEKYEGVYINRLLSASYTPGSVFKLVTTAAALENLSGIEERLYHCEGKLLIGEGVVTCLARHGEITLEQALAHSCNVAFAHIALELGAETLQKYADLSGFNAGLDVDGIKTAAGRVNVLAAEGADLAWAGIGQYTNTANPLNFMAFMGAIANNGVR
ncbi:MAG: penicillin-binding protein, partial [Firmicutes bacterium]|nr:penicillin-binding protein [Bacillota bacterium]